MCFSLACRGWMLLSSIFVFGNALHSAINATTTLYYHQRHSANISCNYLSANYCDIITVTLKKHNNTLCSYLYVKSWICQFCDDNIRFIRNPKTNKTSFEISNLQFNDTGTYSCTVRRLTPPPEEVLWEERTTIIVIERSVVFMSCMRGSNGLPGILCTSEGFYPASLKQQWMRDGEIINSSFSHKVANYSTNADGSFTQKSYLELPAHMFTETIFYCWINHSSLNKPIMANISSSVCYEKRDVTVTVTVVFVVSAVLIVCVIIAVTCKCCKRAQPQSPVEVRVTPESVNQTDLQSEVFYSSLGDHHPVPCSRSPSAVWSPLNTN